MVHRFYVQPNGEPHLLDCFSFFEEKNAQRIPIIIYYCLFKWKRNARLWSAVFIIIKIKCVAKRKCVPLNSFFISSLLHSFICQLFFFHQFRKKSKHWNKILRRGFVAFGLPCGIFFYYFAFSQTNVWTSESVTHTRSISNKMNNQSKWQNSRFLFSFSIN